MLSEYGQAFRKLMIIAGVVCFFVFGFLELTSFYKGFFLTLAGISAVTALLSALAYWLYSDRNGEKSKAKPKNDVE